MFLLNLQTVNSLYQPNTKHTNRFPLGKMFEVLQKRLSVSVLSLCTRPRKRLIDTPETIVPTSDKTPWFCTDSSNSCSKSLRRILEPVSFYNLSGRLFKYLLFYLRKFRKISYILHLDVVFTQLTKSIRSLDE